MRKESAENAAPASEMPFGLYWIGKRKALEEAETPPKAVLSYCEEESVRPGETGNLYIEGDNLTAMKLMAPDYTGKIDLIYIDPPYNTGNDFMYTDGRLHSDWCSMMYARLIAAKKLLADDGAIFISIDDHEVHHLRMLCDEVFGEENFAAMFSWIKTMNPPSLGSKVRDNLEYVLCYEKNFSAARKLYGRESRQKDSPLANAANRENEVMIPAGTCSFTGLAEGTIPSGTKPSGVELRDDITVRGGVNADGFRVFFRSKWGQDNIFKETAAGTRFVVKNHEYFSLRYVKGRINYVVPDKFLDYHKFDVREYEYGRKEVENLLGRVGFEYPKNTPLIVTLLKMYLHDRKDALVMDFFSGSATTAHALLKMNAEDGGNRHFIMIQYPQPCPEGSPAKEAGFKDICAIGKARIRAAGEAIRESTGAAPDDGFKVFKCRDL